MTREVEKICRAALGWGYLAAGEAAGWRGGPADGESEDEAASAVARAGEGLSENGFVPSKPSTSARSAARKTSLYQSQA